MPHSPLHYLQSCGFLVENDFGWIDSSIKKKGSMTSKSVTKCCVFPELNSLSFSSYGSTPVYLNVYDLCTVSRSLYWAGVGAFHSGVQVHGVEYAFGAVDYPESGIFEVKPRECPGYRYKKSVFIGMTSLNPFQVQEFMKDQAANYYGHTYHMVVKNCNHFSEDICYKLTGNTIPKWVNRLARIGSFCSCVTLDVIESTIVRDKDSSQDLESETQSLRCSYS